MAKSNRDEFSARTKRQLAARAGHVCSFEGCRRPTSGPSSEAADASVNLGEACHICAAASGPGARRYDPSLTSTERRSIDNGIWMCRDHAKLIDSDEDTYTVELLRRWKREAESRAELGLRSGSAAEDPDLGLDLDNAPGLQRRVAHRPIRWLHLSDLHLGCRPHELWWQVHEELELSIREMVGRLGPPDLVLQRMTRMRPSSLRIAISARVCGSCLRAR